MIRGIGVDIVEIDRIRKLLADTAFLSRFFTEAEQAFLKRPESVAANYAAKEAYAKALGTGIRGFSLKDIEVLRDGAGKPYIRTYANAKTEGRVHVSLSHEKTHAIAYVIVEE
ncbi:MAG: holo-[acyl-carrier-protein] synthase [Ruminococcaceae bacterium]|nr:holo-[acyl-carrier-protein] synthase [Oscillospiraceae bacterium]